MSTASLSRRWRSFRRHGALWLSPAFAHAVCGDRIFPATLGIDDPGVGDELALPTLTYLPQNADGAQESDAEFSWTKTILPGLGLSVSDGATWQHPGGYGWEGLDTELKYNFFCIPDHEFMAFGRARRRSGVAPARARNIRPSTPTRRFSTSAKASAICRRA